MVNMAEVCSTHKGLVYHIAKQYIKVCEYDRAIDMDDLAQAGYIGLMQAVQTYDETKSSFSTWAAIYIKLEIRKVLGITHRDQRADQGASSLDELLPGAEDITQLDALEAPDDNDHVELVDGVRAIVATLAEPQRTLVQQHDLQGQSLVSAGQSCGLESSAVYRAHQQAIRKLRRDSRLRALAKAHYLDQITNWHRHVGVNEYRTTWMSSTEAIGFWREKQAQQAYTAPS